MQSLLVRRLAPRQSRVERRSLPEDVPGRSASSDKIRPKGHVEAQPLRACSHLPQTEHRVASSSHPVKRDPPLPEYFREFQSQSLAVETHRPLQVSDVQMAFEEIANSNQCSPLSPTLMNNSLAEDAIPAYRFP